MRFEALRALPLEASMARARLDEPPLILLFGLYLPDLRLGILVDELEFPGVPDDPPALGVFPPGAEEDDVVDFQTLEVLAPGAVAARAAEGNVGRASPGVVLMGEAGRGG